MKLISWNINGIRAVAKKGFKNFLNSVQPDILGLQEIKISAASRAAVDFDFSGYEEYWHSAKRPGYSGTAFLVKQGLKVLSVINDGLDKAEFDDEGRVQTLETGKFYLLNVYFPNANNELSRLDYKLRFNSALLAYIKKLERKKPVIVSGDFNVAHEEIDLARPQANIGQAGFTFEERAWMSRFLKAGFMDTFRELNGRRVQYSWWSFRSAARARNVGWRIDYFCASVKLKRLLDRAYILDKVTGSDHAPVGLDLKI